MDIVKSQTNRPLVLVPSQLARHLYVVGQSGVGKTTALLTWFLQFVLRGWGAGLVDPHSDVFNDALSFLAKLADQIPGLAERLVIINPMDSKSLPGLNLLEVIDETPVERTASFLSDVIIKIWHVDQMVATRMISLLRHTFMALSELELTLVELPLFLRDEDLRERLLQRVKNQEVRDYFLKEFPERKREQTEWIQSSLNRMVAFVMDPAIRLIFGQRHSTINFRKIMDEGKILLVNDPKGALGEENAQLFAGVILARMQQAALSRVDSRHRPPFYLLLDEFQSYSTDNISVILSEARKYGLSLIMAHQYLRQIVDPALQAAVLNTTGTMVCFRVGYEDAQILARNIFTPEIDAQRYKKFPIPLTDFGIPLWPPEFRPLQAEWERYVLSLTTLKEREFWTKVRGAAQPLKFTSFNVSHVPAGERINQVRDYLIAVSSERHGRSVVDIRSELLYERPKLIRQLAESAIEISDYQEI